MGGVGGGVGKKGWGGVGGGGGVVKQGDWTRVMNRCHVG